MPVRVPLEELTIRYVRTRGHRRTPDLPVVLEVPTADLTWKSTFSKRQFPTKDSDAAPGCSALAGLVAGPWDRFKRSWERCPHHRSLVQRYEHGLPWSETYFYRYNLAKIHFGHPGDAGVSSVEDLDARCTEIDSLYESIRCRGYVSQTKLDTEEGGTVEINGSTFPNECRLGIDRDGNFIRFSGGRHRISIAKILGIDTVPVLVVVRHRRWQEIRDAVSANHSSPSPVEEDHPDLV